jgi:hypothetical protein
VFLSQETIYNTYSEMGQGKSGLIGIQPPEVYKESFDVSKFPFVGKLVWIDRDIILFIYLLCHHTYTFIGWETTTAIANYSGPNSYTETIYKVY